MVRACRLLARAMIPPLQSLVKYDNPVLVSTTKDNKKKDKKTGKVRPDRAPTRASGRAPLGVERRLLARSGALRARDVSWSQLHHAQARGASVLPPPSAGACARLVRRLTRVPSLPPSPPPAVLILTPALHFAEGAASGRAEARHYTDGGHP